MKVIVRCPSMPWATRLVRATPSSSPSRMRRAVSRKAVPAGVRATLRLLRSNSAVPISASSRRMAWLSGGCAMCRRCAARLKCRVSATAMNWRNSRVSIIEAPGVLIRSPQYIFYLDPGIKKGLPRTPLPGARSKPKRRRGQAPPRIRFRKSAPPRRPHPGDPRDGRTWSAASCPWSRRRRPAPGPSPSGPWSRRACSRRSDQWNRHPYWSGS
ncbi:hypothetical protein LMG26857_02767 [Achromobacter anxifer]|nr:hypothetical protein LMG26857_02767 [Achromobacter anxifer]